MRLVGKKQLVHLSDSRAEANWLKSWVNEVSQAHWKSGVDVLARFPKSGSEAGNVFVFSPAKLKLVIEVKFAFLQGVALIQKVRRLP